MSEINKAGVLQKLRKRKSDLEKKKGSVRAELVGVSRFSMKKEKLILLSGQIALLDELIEEIEK